MTLSLKKVRRSGKLLNILYQDTKVLHYRVADKSLARPDWKKQLKVRHFSSDEEVIAAAETWLEGKHSELFLGGLQKLEFGRCSLFPSLSV